MGNTLGNLGRYDDARRHLMRCLELCQGQETRETEGNAHNYLCQLDYMQGYLIRGLEHGEAAVACMRAAGNPARMAWVLGFRLLILCDLKRPDEYEKYMKEFEEWIERSSNDRIRCVFLLRESMNCGLTGRYEEEVKVALKGVDLAGKIGEGIVSPFLLGYAGHGALHAGRPEYALQLLRRGESEAKKIGHPLGLAVVRIFLAETLLRSGRTEEAKEHVEAALLFCRTLDLGKLLELALEINAEILAQYEPPDRTRIEDMMNQAAALVKRSESTWYRIFHLMAGAKIESKLNRTEIARMRLLEARELYREMGLKDGTGELKAIEEELHKVCLPGKPISAMEE
jgi:tetratricopeptide (TPR) repeat protein